MWNTFVDQWLRVLGLLDVVVCDPGLEFEGHFAEMCQGCGITLPLMHVLLGKMDERSVREECGNIFLRLHRENALLQIRPNTRLLGNCAVRQRINNPIDLVTRPIRESLVAIIVC